MYHAIIINKQFKNTNFPNTKKVFAKKVNGDWEIFGVEVDNLGAFISEVQENMRPDEPWYAHLYNSYELIVIFKNKVIRATHDKSTWSSIYEYAKSINIPDKQLDFQPNTFEGEIKYFDNGKIQ